MTNPTIFTDNLTATKVQSLQSRKLSSVGEEIEVAQTLPALITKKASKQTYYTIRFLVDRDRVVDAYRAYAYFRWVDDELDEKLLNSAERLAFLEHQQELIKSCYTNEMLSNLNIEEELLRDLIRNDQEPHSGLQSYIRNMMAVMAFDADRRERQISQHELHEYTRHLSTAVTEALHYFIGHYDVRPRTPTLPRSDGRSHSTHASRCA